MLEFGVYQRAVKDGGIKNAGKYYIELFYMLCVYYMLIPCHHQIKLYLYSTSPTNVTQSTLHKKYIF